MQTRSIVPNCACILALVVLSISSLAARPLSIQKQDQDKPKVSEDEAKAKPKLPEDEAKAASSINTAPDLDAKLTAAADFVKKYPRSAVRLDVAKYLVGQIDLLKDPARKLALAESFQKTFTDDKELEAIRPVILDAYAQTDHLDEAFSLASTILKTNPDDLHVLVQLTFRGAEAAKRKNEKYLAQSTQYGLKAIELIEANKKPAQMDEATWANHKSVLPQLYQEMGVLALISGNSTEGRARLEKAVTLNPSDPFNYVLIGGIINDDYQRQATRYKEMTDSKQKEEILPQINSLLDSIIDAYAHAVGLSTGRPEYQQLQAPVLQDLTAYYKFRHNQSVEGLQQLIDKYKTPAKP